MISTVTPTAPDVIVDHYLARVVRALGWERWAVVLLMTLLWSTRRLFTADMLDFFTPAEIAFLGIELFAEMAVIATTLMLGYTLLDETLPRLARLRLAVLGAMLLSLSFLMTALLYAYYGHTFDDLPPALRLFSDSLRLGLPAVMLAAVAHMHHRAMRSESAAQAEERSHAQLGQYEAEQQLALLQAQIEPHFLFNVLGNVRRLYRTQPEAGAKTIASLMRYLREALPRLRNQRAQLRDELELVRAYLDLFQVRMGERLSYSIDADPALDGIDFPPMLLLTLVENAIKHGIEPSGRGGHVQVRARRAGKSLEVAVIDDGAGFSAASSGGSGVGLVNLRQQLAARYGEQARLVLASQEPKGVSASIVIPWRAVTTARLERTAAAAAAA